MNWEQTLRLVHLLRQEAQVNGTPAVPRRALAPRRVKAASVCIASGKGGTGKSVVTASLGALLAARGRTLVVDADMGVGNAHILQDVQPERSFVDVVAGRCGVREIVTRCSSGLDLLCAGSGVSRMAGLSPYELHLIAAGLEQLDCEYEFVLVDSAAGISEQTLCFAAACDLVLVVTTSDPTAMTDAYAFLKVLLARRANAIPLLLVNRVTEEGEAERVTDRIAQVCRKFLAREPFPLGRLPEDRAVSRSVAARQAVVRSEPGSPAALALQALTVPLLEELRQASHGGLGARLVRSIGYIANRA